MKNSKKTDHTPLVSIIIPTYNSAATLDVCLASLASQTYPNIEIVIVDNYSRDATDTIAEKYTQTVIKKNAWRTTSRNYGSKVSKGEFIVSLDSDIELSPRVIEECVEKALNNNLDAIILPELRIGEGFWAQCRIFEGKTYSIDSMIWAPRFIKRIVFERIGGYDERLEAWEDWDLRARIESTGHKIGTINALTKHHEGFVRLSDRVRKNYHYGKTCIRYLKKHPNRSRRQISILRLEFLKRRELVVKYPLIFCGMLFMKSIEYITTLLAMLLYSQDFINDTN